MPKPIILKINVSKIDKAHLFKGQKGTYLDLVLIEKADDYGNTHMIVQGVSKEAREQNIRGPILGNCKIEQEAPRQQYQQRQERPPQRQQQTPPAGEGYEDDDIHF